MDRPDKEAHNDQINALNAKIQALEQTRDTITAQINDVSSNSKADNGLSAARKELDALYTQRNTLQRSRDTLLQAQKSIRTTQDKLAAERKSASQSIPYKTVEDIDKAILALQKKQSTTSMSLSDEKKLLKEIDALSASKRTIAALDSKKSSLEQAKKSREELHAALDANKLELDAVYKALDAQKKVIANLNAQSDSTRAVIPNLVQQRNEARNQMNAIKQEIRTLRDEYRTKNNAWFVFMRAQRLQKKIQYEEEKQKREEEYQAKLAAIEAEEAKKIPYEEEMGLCDYLVKYLESTYLNSNDDVASKAAGNDSDVAATVKDDPFANFKPMKKDDDEIYLKMGSGKSQRKKNRNKAAKAATPKMFELNVDTFEQFALINLNPPISFEGVSESIEQLKAKKQWYSEQPRGSVPTAKDIRKSMEAENAKYKMSAAAVAPISADATKKSSGGGKNKYQMTEEDFVPLGSNSAPIAMVNASWGKRA